MPRRTAQQAQKAAIKEIIARTRFLVRDPVFLRDLMKVRQRYKTDPAMESYFEFLNEWDLQWFPLQLMTAGDDLLGTVEGYEAALAKAMIAGMDSPRVQDHFIFRPPVVASCPYETYAVDLVEENLDELVKEGSFKPNVPDYIPGPGKVLDLRVDLSYPQDVLEARIKVELSKAMKNRRNYQRKSLFPPAPQRRRLDKVNFYLRVFDLAEKGETFGKIAKALNRRVSTVKSVFLAVRRNIFGFRPVFQTTTSSGAIASPENGSAPSKQELPLADFDPAKHISQCSVCKKAQTFKGMCIRTRMYALQEHGSQRELTGLDTRRDIRGPGEDDDI